jgi:hypothetical protein
MAKPVRTVTSSCGIVIIIVSGDSPTPALHAVLGTTRDNLQQQRKPCSVEIELGLLCRCNLNLNVH